METLTPSGKSSTVAFQRKPPVVQGPQTDPAVLANKFNEFFTSVGSMTALKAECLAEEHGLKLGIDKHQ